MERRKLTKTLGYSPRKARLPPNATLDSRLSQGRVLLKRKTPMTVDQAGRLGGYRRNAVLSPERRTEIAKAGGIARQKKRQLEIDKNMAVALGKLNDKVEGR